MSGTAPRPTSRPRRLRRTPAMRALVSEVHVRVDDLVAPLFVRAGICTRWFAEAVAAGRIG